MNGIYGSNQSKEEILKKKMSHESFTSYQKVRKIVEENKNINSKVHKFPQNGPVKNNYNEKVSETRNYYEKYQNERQNSKMNKNILEKPNNFSDFKNSKILYSTAENQAKKLENKNSKPRSLLNSHPRKRDRHCRKIKAIGCSKIIRFS